MCEIPCPRCSHGRPMLLLQKVQVSTFGRLPPQEALTSLERSRGWFQKWNRGQLSPESMRARPLEGPLRALELIDGAALASFSNNGDCRSHLSVHVTNPYPSPFYWIMYVHVDIHKFCHMEWLPSNGSSNTDPSRRPLDPDGTIAIAGDSTCHSWNKMPLIPLGPSAATNCEVEYGRCNLEL